MFVSSVCHVGGCLARSLQRCGNLNYPLVDPEVLSLSSPNPGTAPPPMFAHAQRKVTFSKRNVFEVGSNVLSLLVNPADPLELPTPHTGRYVCLHLATVVFPQGL